MEILRGRAQDIKDLTVPIAKRIVHDTGNDLEYTQANICASWGESITIKWPKRSSPDVKGKLMMMDFISLPSDCQFVLYLLVKENRPLKPFCFIYTELSYNNVNLEFQEPHKGRLESRRSSLPWDEVEKTEVPDQMDSGTVKSFEDVKEIEVE